MGRTNYSLNEMLNAVTKRAFNRYTPQTVDYQHLEAATTKTGLVSNRREYSSASILADTFSLNATNIVESNYDPFLKTFISDSIDKKTFQIGGGYAFTFTDDRRFMAVTTLFNNTDLNEVRVYEFDETLVEQFELATTGTIDTSSYAQTFDVDINHDGSQIFVLKRFGTSAEHHYGVDVFDETFAIISSTTFITMPLDPFNEPSASLSVTEDGNRVCMSLYVSDLFIRVHDNLNISAYYSILINDVSTTFFSLMSKNGRTLVVSNSGTILTFEIPTTSPSGIVTLNPVQTQVMGIHHFDLSHDGKVMLTHSGSGVQIYTWNGLQWKQVGQNISTGLTQVYSSAISYYADYFVVASDSQMKVFKWNRNSKIFEQYGDTMRGDFGTVEQKIQINKSGDTVVIGNSQKNSSTGRSYTYVHEGERWGLINETNGSATGDALGKFLRVSNNGDKIILGMTGEISMKTTNLINKSSGWKQRGNTLIATTVNDGFGTSLSLSNDGKYLAIGIPTSFSFTDIGTVKIYEFSTGIWSQFKELLGDDNEKFGKYVTISLNGSKVAVGNEKNNIVKVFIVTETDTKTIPSSGVVDTISITPQNSILEMSGDGNRLFLKTGQFTVWDKNTDDVWVYTNAFSDGDAVHLSNNGTYVSVDHNTTARLYEIDSSGVVSKIGSDITPFTLLNSTNTIRSFNPTHININTSNSGHLNLASYLDSTQQVEICSLTWDDTLVPTPQIVPTIRNFSTEQGFGISVTGFTGMTPGVALSRNGQFLVIYDSNHFNIYRYDVSRWKLVRSKNVSTISYFAISYDGSVIAYLKPGYITAIVTENTISGTFLGQISENPTSFAFRDSSTLAVATNVIRIYRYINDVWLLEDSIVSGYSGPFVGTHSQWSGDGSILAIGDVFNGRVTFYNYSPNGLTLHSFIEGGGSLFENFGSVIDISNDGTTVIVGAPGNETSSYRGYAKVYDYESGAWTVRMTITNDNLYDISTSGSIVTVSSSEYIDVGQNVHLTSDAQIFGYRSRNISYTKNFLKFHTEIIDLSSTDDYQNEINNVYNGGDWGVTYRPAFVNSFYIYYSLIELNNGGIWFPSKLGPSWSVSFDWWSDDDEIHFIFFAPNQPSSMSGTQHGGYSITFNQNSGIGIYSPDGTLLDSIDVDFVTGTFSYYTTWVEVYNPDEGYVYIPRTVYNFNNWKNIVINYDNGVLTVITSGVEWTYTFVNADIEDQVSSWGTSTYMAIAGNQYVRGINISTEIYKKVEIDITEDYENRLVNIFNGGYINTYGDISFNTNDIRICEYKSTATNYAHGGIWLPVQFGAKWSVSYEWKYDPGDGRHMNFIFYSTNQPIGYTPISNHNGYMIQFNFIGTDYQKLYSTSNNTLDDVWGITYPMNTWMTVNISYDNGVLSMGVEGITQRTYTFVGTDLSDQQALWNTTTYMAIIGYGEVYRSGFTTYRRCSNQFIRNIYVDHQPVTVSNEVHIRYNNLVNPVYLPDLTTPSEILNATENIQLYGMAMSYDGTQIALRVSSGYSQDVIMKNVLNNYMVSGWTRRGDIINFTAPISIASNSLRALSSSSDGNVIAFGMNTMVKVYGFSDDAWSQLGSDILPSVSNPGDISMDISSDGMVIAILISRTTSDPTVCKVFAYSSGSWSQSGSSIDFGVGGTNKVKISGDGTTVALGKVGDLSNVIRVYKKGQDWELISPTLLNSFEDGLNLTDDGTRLVTLNTSGVEFSTFSTQLVTYTPQYLNDITIPGTTEDMGDIRLSDSGDRLFVMAGDEKIHVYDNLHNEEFVTGAQLSVRNFSVNGDGSYIVLTNDVGNVAVFGRTNTSWSPIGSEIITNMTGGVSTDINGDGTSIVLVSPNDDLRLYTYEGGTWSQANSSTGTRGTSVFISDTADIIVGNIESIKTFEIKDVIQDISFSAPTLSLDGDEYIRLNAGSVYTENGATITTTATTTPTVKISGSVVTREPGIYTIQYEAEDIQRKTAEPIFRKVEVIPSVSIIKLEGPGVIYHTQGTALKDPGVTASVPVSVYYTAPDSTLVISGFPNFLTATTLGEYKIYYTNDIPDKYLRSSLLVKRSVFVRARPILSLAGASTVFNPLNQTYNDLGVTFTQPEVSSPIVSVTFNTPRVGVTETQTVTYNAKDQFGIEAIPITRQVIVKKRPTITTSGTLYRILNDPISIPAPTVTPSTLSGVVQTSNNININQIGDYSITYDVTDTDGISSVTTRQRYEVGSYGKHTLSKSGTLSTFSRDGRSLAIFSTNVQIYKLDADGSWVSNGFITIPSGSPVTSMNFSYHGRHIIIGMSSHFTIGLVRVYKENTLFTGGWEQVGLDIFGVDYLGKFGHAVEINELGTRIFVSAPEANTNSGTLFRGGLVKIFKWDGTFWFEEKTFEGFSPAELFGTSISISTDGKVLAVGSPGYTRSTIAEDDTVTTVNVGKTSIYKFIDNVWEDYVGTDIEDGTEGARNGFSLSMSGNGKILAVGSESGGGVRVYSIGALRWSPLGSHISGSFGKSVSLSDDNTLVIGSEDENYGRVYIYNLESDWSKSSPTFDKVIVAESDVNDMGKRVHVNASGTFTCVDSETEVRVYEI